MLTKVPQTILILTMYLSFIVLFLNGGSDSLDSLRLKILLYISFLFPSTPVSTYTSTASHSILLLHSPRLGYLFILFILQPTLDLSSLVLTLLKLYSKFPTNDSSNRYNLTASVVMIAY